MKNQEIETRKNCTKCGKEFLMSHLCISCRQKKNLLTEYNLLQVDNMVKLISIKDIKDDDVIIMQYDGDLKDISKLQNFNSVASEVASKILEITQKNITFISIGGGMKIEHIPEAKLKSIGLARVKKNDGKGADISY